MIEIHETLSVGVVIPAYNEAPFIDTVIRAARAVPEVDEVLVIDDGSADSTAEVATKERARVVSHELNRGSTDFGDLATRLLQALGDSRRQELALNLRNDDMIEELHRDTVVESVVEVEEDAVHRVPAPNLPASEVELIQQLERYQRATAQAIAEKKQHLLPEALAENPLVDNLDTARLLLRRAAELCGSEVTLL